MLQEYDWFSPYTSLGRDSNNAPTPFSTTLAATRTSTKSYKYPASDSFTGSEAISDDIDAYWHPGSHVVRNLMTSASRTGLGPGSSATYSYFDGFGHPNLIDEFHYDSYSGANVAIHYQYDAFGNPTQIQNARENITTYGYSGNDCLTQRIEALGTAQARTFNYTCDANRGLMLTATDVDHAITRSYDYDRFGRNTLTTESGGGIGRKQQTIYSDGSRSVLVKSDLNSNGDLALSRTTWFDQFGRVRQTSDPAGNIVKTRYYTPPSGNAFGFSYKVVSNPYLSGGNTTGWTLTAFDRNGRVSRLQHFSGSAEPSPWVGANPSSTGTVSTSYSSNTATVTDESNAATWVKYVDGLGRLQQVTESRITDPATGLVVD
jgi:YD repeat-containing protein